MLAVLCAAGSPVALHSQDGNCFSHFSFETTGLEQCWFSHNNLQTLFANELLLTPDYQSISASLCLCVCVRKCVMERVCGLLVSLCGWRRRRRRSCNLLFSVCRSLYSLSLSTGSCSTSGSVLVPSSQGGRRPCDQRAAVPPGGSDRLLVCLCFFCSFHSFSVAQLSYCEQLLPLFFFFVSNLRYLELLLCGGAHGRDVLRQIMTSGGGMKNLLPACKIHASRFISTLTVLENHLFTNKLPQMEGTSSSSALSDLILSFLVFRTMKMESSCCKTKAASSRLVTLRMSLLLISSSSALHAL